MDLYATNNFLMLGLDFYNFRVKADIVTLDYQSIFEYSTILSYSIGF